MDQVWLYIKNGEQSLAKENHFSNQNQFLAVTNGQWETYYVYQKWSLTPQTTALLAADLRLIFKKQAPPYKFSGEPATSMGVACKTKWQLIAVILYLSTLNFY